MKTSAAGIIFSNLNNNTLSELTVDRTVAAIPFACRYRLVDFSLSNLVNANISNIHIVANYNYRSLVDHIGSGKDWDLARRKGGINLVSPYQTSRSPNASLYSYHMEALINMKEHLAEMSEDTVVLMDSDQVLNIDLRNVIDRHEKSNADITFVTKNLEPDFECKRPRLMIGSVKDKITALTTGVRYREGTPEVSLNIFVMKTAYLHKILSDAEERNMKSLTEYMIQTYKHANYRTHKFDGYVASVSSFLDYYHCSMDMAKNEEARSSLLMQKDMPIFTKVHNSAPTVYKSTARVQNSMIADDCVIEGTVMNSVLARGVHVAKGAVVKNSVLYSGDYVGEGASLNCVVADKDVHISKNVNISGNDNLPIYIEKGRKV